MPRPFFQDTLIPGGGTYRGQFIVGSAAPTAGDWVAGDICWNSEPSAGEVLAWFCVTSGTPGTWQALGSAGATETLTNKSLDLASNTLTGTLAEFNTALSDANFASLAGAEALTNKTLTAPVINNPTTTAGVGAKNGATVTVVENAPGVFKSVMTLTATPITFTDDAGAGQWGGAKLYDLPAGNVLVLGAVVDADVTLNETWWVDTKEGDVGLGTTLVTDGDALATTEQNIIPTTAVAALVAQAGPINAQSTGSLYTAAAGTTDADVYLNLRIDDDAAHMPDIVTNGAFAADTDWTKGDGWTIAAGVADSDGTQADVSDLEQVTGDLVHALVEGVTYATSITVTRSAGSVQLIVGGTAGTARSSANTFAEDIVAGSGTSIVLRASEDFVGTVDDVVITPKTGTGTVTGTVTVTWLNLGDF